ncbi:type II toxin-antitoxin system VapC family toxin [Sphingobium boeckii]|uniref:PIN domain nuclease of toxin-antitoxin system n=1 Tax=Sphingobium boeckii TaxID=1082345 RepID=A0A7W9AG59_9SPHN|nr:type II toxin-antitoxin system VapC family toxin [Sphingobium boeckii]MBB5685060.1 PIN domain nuclease of toxin-antitoxin system [Sphingobium boeckii]
MRLMLDTHVALWAILDDPRLAKHAADMICHADNRIFISAATIWEIAIKHALARGHKDDMPVSAGNAVAYFGQAGFEMLPITADHAVAAGDLPALHADPFDRMLIAQAMAEPLRLITHDRQVAAYDDGILLI